MRLFASQEAELCSSRKSRQRASPWLTTPTSTWTKEATCRVVQYFLTPLELHCVSKIPPFSITSAIGRIKMFLMQTIHRCQCIRVARGVLVGWFVRAHDSFAWSYTNWLNGPPQLHVLPEFKYVQSMQRIYFLTFIYTQCMVRKIVLLFKCTQVFSCIGYCALWSFCKIENSSSMHIICIALMPGAVRGTIPTSLIFATYPTRECIRWKQCWHHQKNSCWWQFAHAIL